jgi:hypothetical protein
MEKQQATNYEEAFLKEKKSKIASAAIITQQGVILK